MLTILCDLAFFLELLVKCAPNGFSFVIGALLYVQVFVWRQAIRTNAEHLFCLLHSLLYSPDFSNAATGVQAVKRLFAQREHVSIADLPLETSLMGRKSFGAWFLMVEEMEGLRSLASAATLAKQVRIHTYFE